MFLLADKLISIAVSFIVPARPSRPGILGILNLCAQLILSSDKLRRNGGDHTIGSSSSSSSPGQAAVYLTQSLSSAVKKNREGLGTALEELSDQGNSMGSCFSVKRLFYNILLKREAICPTIHLFRLFKC